MYVSMWFVKDLLVFHGRRWDSWILPSIMLFSEELGEEWSKPAMNGVHQLFPRFSEQTFNGQNGNKGFTFAASLRVNQHRSLLKNSKSWREYTAGDHS